MDIGIKETVATAMLPEALAKAIEKRIVVQMLPDRPRSATITARMRPGTVRALETVAKLEGGATTISGVVARAVVQYLSAYTNSIRGQVAIETVGAEFAELVSALPPGELPEGRTDFVRNRRGLVVRTKDGRLYRMYGPGLAARIEPGPEPTGIAFFADGQLVDEGVVDDNGYRPTEGILELAGVGGD